MTKKRFRGSIYVDVFIDDEVVGLERQRILAEEELIEKVKTLGNAYIGGVATMDELKNKTKEI